MALVANGGLGILAQNVIIPLKNGLRSFNRVSEMLLRNDIDIILPGCQTYRDVREQIEYMNAQMQESQRIAANELQSIDRDTESLTAELNQLTNQKNQRESELRGLTMDLDTHRSSLQNYRQSLETERRNLDSTRETLENMKRRKQGGEIMTGVGAGLLVIPIVGWIAGGALLGVGIHEMNQAAAAVDDANDKVNNCQHYINHYSNQVSELESKIRQVESDIQRAEGRICDAEARRQAVSAKRMIVANLQDKSRRAVVQLEQVCSVGSVAELQTRYLIMLQPLIKVMEEMTTALGQITGDDLLRNEGIHSLICDMKHYHTKLMEHKEGTINTSPRIRLWLPLLSLSKCFTCFNRCPSVTGNGT